MTTVDPIAFNRPARSPNEDEYVLAAIASGHSSSGGEFSARASAILREVTGAPATLLTTSCTSALEMTAMLLELGPEDTVIVPSYTFTSSALAYARQGARILFCDIEPTTLGPDPESVSQLLDDSVRAVVAVHYAGIACDLAGLRKVLADRPDVTLIEDNAHGLFGSFDGEPLGSAGRFSTLSFHETKNVVCGEGGALVLNDPDDVARAQVLYDKGTDRQAFFAGLVDKYSWRDTGSSFGMSDVLAAYLTGQLEDRSAIQARRQQIWSTYYDALLPVADELELQLPTVPAGCQPAWHLFHVLLRDRAQRPAVMADLRDEGIATAFHYVPLHNSAAGKQFALRPTECPVSVDVATRLLRLPFHVHLTDSDLERVVDRFVAAVRRHA